MISVYTTTISDDRGGCIEVVSWKIRSGEARILTNPSPALKDLVYMMRRHW